MDHDDGVKEGAWDSIHVFNVVRQENTYHYNCVSTVFLKMISENANTFGQLDIAGTLMKESKTSKQSAKPDDKFHISNMGNLMEDNENYLFKDIERIYLGKSK